MSEEIRTADANLHALHAERAALRQAAQTAGIVVWANGDTYHAALNGAEATGATLGAAIVALCARVAEREVTTRADLDTLRNGVAGWRAGAGEGVGAGVEAGGDKTLDQRMAARRYFTRRTRAAARRRGGAT